jgi:hypothetical protein
VLRRRIETLGKSPTTGRKWWALQDSNLGGQEEELTISSTYNVVEVTGDKPATSAQAAQFAVNERMAPHSQSLIVHL